MRPCKCHGSGYQVSRCQGDLSVGVKCNHWGNYTRAKCKGCKSNAALFLSGLLKVVIKPRWDCTKSSRAWDGRNSNDSHHLVCGSDYMSPLITCPRYLVFTITRRDIRHSHLLKGSHPSMATHSHLCMLSPSCQPFYSFCGFNILRHLLDYWSKTWKRVSFKNRTEKARNGRETTDRKNGSKLSARNRFRRPNIIFITI